MKKLLILLGLLALLSVSLYAQVTPAPVVTGSNSGDGELKVVITQLNLNDAIISDSLDEIRNDLGGSAITAHSDLTGIGTLTHPELEASLDEKLDESDTVDLATVVKILTDTSLYFTVTWGAKNPGDTVGFNLDSIFWDTDWDVSHVLNITKISAKVSGGAPDIDLAFLVNSTPIASGATAILSADMTVTTKVTWTDATSFNDNTIGKGESIMVRIDQLTSKPTSLTFNIFGYLTE